MHGQGGQGGHSGALLGQRHRAVIGAEEAQKEAHREHSSPVGQLINAHLSFCILLLFRTAGRAVLGACLHVGRKVLVGIRARSSVRLIDARPLAPGQGQMTGSRRALSCRLRAQTDVPSRTGCVRTCMRASMHAGLYKMLTVRVRAVPIPSF